MKYLPLIIACFCLFVFSASAQNVWPPLRKTKIDFAKKIANAMPEAFPSSPDAKATRSDTEDENLKGKVKVEVKYNVDHRDKVIARELEEEKDFDENGGLIRSIYYVDGYPDTVTAYGYIDGMRVSRSKDVEYADGEKTFQRGMMLKVNADDNLKNPSAPKDTRYGMRYEYKYDSLSRLVEKRTITNNGELWSRTTWTYNGNQRDERDYGNDGQEWGHTLETLDNKGNVLERRLYNGPNSISDIEVNQYEFDANGNWIVTKTYDSKKVRGKTVLKPLWTTYRTITYYP